MRKVISKLLDCSEKSYYRWKQEGRPIIPFLEQFEESELQELLQNGKISLLEEFRQFKMTKESDPEYQMFKKFLKFQAWEEFQKKQND